MYNLTKCCYNWVKTGPSLECICDDAPALHVSRLSTKYRAYRAGEEVVVTTPTSYTCFTSSQVAAKRQQRHFYSITDTCSHGTRHAVQYNITRQVTGFKLQRWLSDTLVCCRPQGHWKKKRQVSSTLTMSNFHAASFQRRAGPVLLSPSLNKGSHLSSCQGVCTHNFWLLTARTVGQEAVLNRPHAQSRFLCSSQG